MRTIKLIQAATGILSLAAWFSSVALFMRYDAVMPTHPDVPSGAIYAQANHGHIVYLTASEKHTWYGLMALAGVLFLISAALSLHLALIKRSQT